MRRVRGAGISVTAVDNGHDGGASAAPTVPDATMQSARKRSRLGRPKVRTGCVTCKIRRVKCDEGKPHCIRCLSTGRTCDGYTSPDPSIHNMNMTNAATPDNDAERTMTAGDPAPATSTSDGFSTATTTLWNPFLNYSGTQLEHRYLSFFQHQTAPILSGYFDAYFWNGLLLQVGHSEPTIQHAMMAVASMHEQIEAMGRRTLSHHNQHRFYHNGDGDGLEHSRYFALQQYNKAIACLNCRLRSGPQSEQITLLCCILFICLEFLRSNINSAIRHLHSGLQIMTVWRAQNRALLLQDNEAVPQITVEEPQSILDNIVQMFSRLTIQSMLCGRDPRTVPGIRLNDISSSDLAALTPDVFPSIQVARTALDNLMKISLQLIRDSHTENLLFRPEFKGRLDELLSALERWSRAFDLFLVITLTSRTDQEVRAATVLRILSMVAKIWLSNSVSIEERIFDREITAFSSIINLAATIIPSCAPGDGAGLADINTSPVPPLQQSNHQHHPPSLYSFTFEMGLIPPLYFVALKCRHPLLRRRAISLLERTQPRREGFWIADLAVAITKRVVEIEELDLQKDGIWLDSIGKGAVEDGSLVPPEWRRVSDARFRARGEKEMYNRVQRIGIVMRAKGAAVEWVERDEDIFW